MKRQQQPSDIDIVVERVARRRIARLATPAPVSPQRPTTTDPSKVNQPAVPASGRHVLLGRYTSGVNPKISPPGRRVR